MAVHQPLRGEVERRRATAAGKLAATVELITKGVMAMSTGREWDDFLHFAARFRHFSFNNVLLVQLQRPEASYVASYDTWVTLGRQVRRGETGISVIAADLIHGDNATTSITSRVMQPRDATVFDISQVDPIGQGRPVADVLAPPVFAGAPVLPEMREDLERQLLARGYTVIAADLADDQLAAIDYTQKVVVSGGGSELRAVAALAGQLARAVLHDDRADEPPIGETVRQVQAASAARMVLAAQGVDTGGLPPLHGPRDWGGPIAGADVDAYVSLVRDVGNHSILAARTILDRIEPAPTATVDQVRQLRARAERTSAAAAAAPPISRRPRTPQPRTPAITAPRPETVERLASVTAATLSYFLDFGRADIARNYLAGRGVTLPDGYIAGYAPVGGGLVQWLKDQGFAEHLQVAAGVTRVANNERVVDVFRDRIVFPICDGPVVAGFTGRATRDSDFKYLNTPAVELFEKSRLLYGLTEGAQRLRGGALPVLVEGPMDALAIAQYPSRLVSVAAMGTAFTDRHVMTLAAAVPDKRIIIALDDDAAGRNAAVAAGEKLAAAGWQVRVPRSADGLDPADIAAAHGAKVIDWLDPQRCRPLIYLAVEEKVRSVGPMDWIEQKVQAARATWAYLEQAFPTDPARHHAINLAADLCGVMRPAPPDPPPQQRSSSHDLAAARRVDSDVSAAASNSR